MKYEKDQDEEEMDDEDEDDMEESMHGKKHKMKKESMSKKDHDDDDDDDDDEEEMEEDHDGKYDDSLKTRNQGATKSPHKKHSKGKKNEGVGVTFGKIPHDDEIQKKSKELSKMKPKSTPIAERFAKIKAFLDEKHDGKFDTALKDRKVPKKDKENSKSDMGKTINPHGKHMDKDHEKVVKDNTKD